MKETGGKAKKIIRVLKQEEKEKVKALLITQRAYYDNKIDT